MSKSTLKTVSRRCSLISKNRVSVDITSIPDYLKKLNKAYSLWKEIKGMAQPEPDLKLDEVKAQYEFLKKTYDSVTAANENITLALQNEIKNVKLANDILEIQNYQFSLISDIQSKIDTINSTISIALPNIMRSISSISKINKNIVREIQVSNIVIAAVFEEINQIRNILSLNNMLIQVNQPYHFLIFACDTYDQLSEALVDLNSSTFFKESDTDSIIESKELYEMLEFSDSVCEEGSNGIIYNIDVLYNEISGQNIMSDKIIGRMASYIFNNLSEYPAANSALSILATTITEFNFIIVRALSALVMSSNFTGKDIDKSIGRVGDIIKAQSVLLVDTLLDNVNNSDRMTMLSSFYTNEWIISPEDPSNISTPEALFLSADQGKAIVGIEVVNDNGKCIFKIYQADVFENYIVDGDNVSTKEIDLSNILLGYDNLANINMSNSKFSTSTNEKRFNDNYLVTKIAFSYDDSEFYSYEVFASKYNKDSGLVSDGYEKADENNSVDVSELVRDSITNFYKDVELPAGIPATKMVDDNSSPVRGIYFVIAGEQAINICPAVLMTDTFIDEQIKSNKNIPI